MTVEIPYHEKLWVGEGITEKQLDKIKKRLSANPLRARVYLLTLSRNGTDQLDIYAGKTLAWPYYRSHPPVVVGIARTYEDSLRMVEQMVQECWKERGDCDLREYLSC